MKKILLLIFLLLTIDILAWDWWPLPIEQGVSYSDTLEYSVGLSVTAGSGKYNAFWLHNNQHGCVSEAPYSGALNLLVEKSANNHSRWYDYDFAVDVYGLVHSSLPNSVSQTLKNFPIYQSAHFSSVLHRCYAHARLYVVDIAAGVMPVEDGMGTILGTGSLLLSNNAASMPAIQIGINRWTAFPGLYGYMEIKGGLLHAWLTDDAYIRNTKLHYKHIGVQFGGKLPVNISYEFHHAAQWGGYSPDGKSLGNDWQAFYNAIMAKNGGDSFNEKYNAQGNHLGSQQIALTAKGNMWKAQVYWQNLLEDNFAFIGTGQNLPDGRWGIHLTQQKWPFLHSMTIEYVCTADQSGPTHDQDGIIYAGNDNYYVNSIYRQGWNYYLRSLGTPLITSPIYNSNKYLQTTNNRVKVWHVGIAGDIFGFNYSFMGTHMHNYGCYNSNDWYTMISQNTSLLLSVDKHVKQAWGLQFGLRLAADIGNQWGNQFSAMLTIKKMGILTTY